MYCELRVEAQWSLVTNKHLKFAETEVYFHEINNLLI